MGGLGIASILAGVYFVYSGYRNVSPIKTIQLALQNPSQVRQIFANRANVIDPGAASTNTVNTTSNTDSSTGSQTQTKSGSSVVSFAKSQIGKPYIFGGVGNPGWDCSGLVQAALATVGVNVAHSATAQYLSTQGKFVRNGDGSKPSLKNLSALVPGDIVFPYAPNLGDVGHVGIYSGNGNFVEAAKPGTNVREIPLYALYDAKRFM